MKSGTLISALIPAVFYILSGCHPKADPDSLKQSLMEADRDFSELSRTKGVNFAFMSYLADDGTLLRTDMMPVEGREKIRELFTSPDTAFTLTWQPLFADAARSGELGYTYGTYQFEMHSPDRGTVTSSGTYVSIWKKDRDGNWKLALDSGNQGLGNEPEDSE